MQAIEISARQAGKTLKMVNWLREDPDNRVILCSSEQRRRELMEIYGLTAGQVWHAPA